MEQILGFIIEAVAVGLALWLVLRRRRGGKAVYTYRRKEFLMSRAEHDFFDIITKAVGGQYYVFPQVHLPNILDHKIIRQNWRGALSHIDRKSVDFVICDKAYIKPRLAIELDDRTHEREGRIERDGEVERILNEAGMPFLRFMNNGRFDKEEIKNLILEKLSEK